MERYSVEVKNANKPNGFAMLDKDGKLPGSVLPEGAGGGGPAAVVLSVDTTKYQGYTTYTAEGWTGKTLFDAIAAGQIAGFFAMQENTDQGGKTIEQCVPIPLVDASHYTNPNQASPYQFTVTARGSQLVLVATADTAPEGSL